MPSRSTVPHPKRSTTLPPLFKADWTGSVFGGANNTVRLAYPPLLQPARKELAICNTDRKSIQNLFGLVGKFGFKLSDTDPGVPVTFSITDVRLIDANDIEWPVNPGHTVLETSAVHDVLNPPGAMKIFPNPTQLEATLYALSLGTDPLVVELYDAAGRLGQRLESYSQDGVALLHLPVLPDGLYMARAFSKEGVCIGRLMVR